MTSGADRLGLKDLSFGSRIIANAIVAGTISELTGGKFANGAMSAAFRVAFNDLNEPGDGSNLKPLVSRDKAEALVDKVMTFEGAGEDVKIARSMAIDIAQTQEGYDGLSYGYAQEGILVKVKNNSVSSTQSYQFRNRRDIIELNIGAVNIWSPDTAGGFVRSPTRGFAHELGHVFEGHFGGADSFQEQYTVDKWENPITRSLNALRPGFGQRGDYYKDVTSIPNNSRVYK